MCHAVKCRVCGKTTWAGCGQHIEAVRRTVPPSQWCPGHPDQQREEPARGGIFSRLGGRSRQS
ncbi:MAG: hypothetical protein FWF28_01140 [Micrococcales bacterium]|nr:hypothetical protein [Micrococcales bacterium]